MAKKCIVCNSDKYIKLYQNNSFLGYPAYICNKCKLYFVFCSGKEVQERCKEFYSRVYWNKFRKKWEDKRRLLNIIIKILRSLNIHPLHQAWHYRIIKKFYPRTKSKKLLEIGCGKGETLIYFSKIGFDVRGIEPDVDNTKKINRYFKRKVCIDDLAENIKIKEKFDVIYLYRVFEHLFRPDLFLEKIKNNLNKDGIIFLDVPNCENKKVLYKSINNNPHIYNFTSKSIKKLFEKHNYKILKICTYSEISRNYIIKFILMLLRLNNYKETQNTKGTGICILAKNKN